MSAIKRKIQHAWWYWYQWHSLQWRHNGHDSVSNHHPHDYLLNRLFRRRSKKTSKLLVTGLCAGNSPETGEFPAQMASNAKNVSIWWRHHGDQWQCYPIDLQLAHLRSSGKARYVVSFMSFFLGFVRTRVFYITIVVENMSASVSGAISTVFAIYRFVSPICDYDQGLLDWHCGLPSELSRQVPCQYAPFVRLSSAAPDSPLGLRDLTQFQGKETCFLSKGIRGCVYLASFQKESEVVFTMHPFKWNQMCLPCILSNGIRGCVYHESFQWNVMLRLPCIFQVESEAVFTMHPSKRSQRLRFPCVLSKWIRSCVYHASFQKESEVSLPCILSKGIRGCVYYASFRNESEAVFTTNHFEKNQRLCLPCISKGTRGCLSYQLIYPCDIWL